MRPQSPNAPPPPPKPLHLTMSVKKPAEQRAYPQMPDWTRGDGAEEEDSGEPTWKRGKTPQVGEMLAGQKEIGDEPEYRRRTVRLASDNGEGGSTIRRRRSTVKGKGIRTSIFFDATRPNPLVDPNTPPVPAIPTEIASKSTPQTSEFVSNQDDEVEEDPNQLDIIECFSALSLHAFEGETAFGELSFPGNVHLVIEVEDLGGGWSLGFVEEVGESGRGLIPRGYYKMIEISEPASDLPPPASERDGTPLDPTSHEDGASERASQYDIVAEPTPNLSTPSSLATSTPLPPSPSLSTPANHSPPASSPSPSFPSKRPTRPLPTPLESSSTPEQTSTSPRSLALPNHIYHASDPDETPFASRSIGRHVIVSGVEFEPTHSLPPSPVKLPFTPPLESSLPNSPLPTKDEMESFFGPLMESKKLDFGDKPEMGERRMSLSIVKEEEGDDSQEAREARWAKVVEEAERSESVEYTWEAGERESLETYESFPTLETPWDDEIEVLAVSTTPPDLLPLDVNPHPLSPTSPMSPSSDSTSIFDRLGFGSTTKSTSPAMVAKDVVANGKTSHVRRIGSKKGKSVIADWIWEGPEHSQTPDDVAYYIESGPTWRNDKPSFTVHVHTPERRTSFGKSEYIVFHLTTVFDEDLASESPSPSVTVDRRYSHFILLRSVLTSNFPLLVIPELPSKSYTGNFQQQFLETRRRNLERWCSRVGRHPVLGACEEVRGFLTVEQDKDLVNLLMPNTSSLSASFFAKVFHPDFNVHIPEAEELVDRFQRHAKATEMGQGLKEFEVSVGKHRERLRDTATSLYALAHSLGRLISGASAPHSVAADIEEAPSQSDAERTKRRAVASCLQTEDEAYTCKESCDHALSMTKAVQATGESMLAVADLYDDNARSSLLPLQELLRELEFPLAQHTGLIEAHREALKQHAELLDDTGEDLPYHREDAVARCETVLNITGAELERASNERTEDLRASAQLYLDTQIAFHQQALDKLEFARSHFDAEAFISLAQTGPRLRSVIERPPPPLAALPIPSLYGLPSSQQGLGVSGVGEALTEGVGTVLGLRGREAMMQVSKVLSASSAAYSSPALRRPVSVLLSYHRYGGMTPSASAPMRPIAIAPATTLPTETPSPAGPSAPGKRKKKVKNEDDSEDDTEEGRTRKRNRMSLSCRECKRRKIKCDRAMPCCGPCEKRGRPGECAWDIFSEEGALPPTIARTSAVEAVMARLEHIESYLKTLPPNLASFKPYNPPSTSDPALSDPTKKGISSVAHTETFSDTEDAAMDVESGIFGGRALPFEIESSHPSRPVASKATKRKHHDSDKPRSENGAREVRFNGRPVELTKALTSIVAQERAPGTLPSRAHLNVEFNATPLEIEMARKEALQRIYRALPSREVVSHLVSLFFTSSWLFHHLHAPSFMAELEAFDTMLDTGRSAEVDVLWVALLFMVLCVALDSTHAARSPLSLDATRTSGHDPLATFSEIELRSLPETWFQAAQAAMSLGDWETVPRIRSVQTIVLFTQYLQLSSANRGQPSQIVTWLAGAIRIAQVLGLHLLGSNPEVMPSDDPAWPPGKNSLKRESAKRLWGVLVYQDWIGASSKNRSYLISPFHFDTDDPLNLNDSDLSMIDWNVSPAPQSVLTDSTSDRVRLAMARQVRKVFDAVVLTKDFTYDTVLELDRGYRNILETLPDRWTLEISAEESEQPMLRYQRHFALEGLHNRIFRLHRPFSTRGYSQPKYRSSTDACLKSARVVIVSTHNISDACRDIWYVYSHVMGAALVLFNDLFQAIDHDLSAAEIDSKRDTLMLASQIFSQSEAIASPSLQSIVEQGGKILNGLFRAEEVRRVGRAAHTLLAASSGTPYEEEEEEVETFAEVLHRVSRSLHNQSAPHRGTPPPTRNIPPSSVFRPTPAPAPYAPVSGSSTEVSLVDVTWPGPPPPENPADDLSFQFFQDLGMLNGVQPTGDFWAQNDALMTSLNTSAAMPDASAFAWDGDGTRLEGGGNQISALLDQMGGW